MHITLLAVGTRGDVQPYVALGLGLTQAGHGVRVATHEAFKELVEGNGLEFAPLTVDIQAVMRGPEGQRWVESGENQLRFLISMIRLAFPTLRRMLDDSWHACQDTDAILYSAFAIAGYSVAEGLGIPSIAAPLQPLTRTRAFSMMGFPVFDLGAQLNRTTYLLGEQLMWQPFRMVMNKWRAESLGLPALPFRGPFGYLNNKQHPWLYGFSPSVIRRPADWDSWVHIAGYWFLDLPLNWSPPDRVVNFLTAGPPPICIGFGSMVDRERAKLLRVAIQALQQNGQRGILLTGWGGMQDIEYPKEILAVELIPHEWLFPRMAAIVHHGGAGTTAAALRSGVPSILTPFFADQPFWGKVVERLGVGTAPILRKKLSVSRLAEAIRMATRDEGMKSRAGSLGEKIRKEDGVKRAVDIVEEVIGS